jgi:DNA-binding transcriptional LysR family regulator
MRFRQYDNLRSCVVVARHLNMGDAARELNLSKGAVSYQVRQLEAELGFPVFSRSRRNLVLTEQGSDLMQLSGRLFDGLERKVAELRQQDQQRITIGMATYFASRWLSPRLMHFITEHADIGLRIQPLVDLMDLRSNELDLAVRWGKGGWHEPDYEIELIFACPALLTTSAEIGKRIETEGLEQTISSQTLLHDRDGSAAWLDWFAAAQIESSGSSDNLVIPDPNVRVQAVIDGQGIALYDRLVDDEVAAGRLYQYRPVSLADYGYYLVYPRALDRGPAIKTFRDWIVREAHTDRKAGQ